MRNIERLLSLEFRYRNRTLDIKNHFYLEAVFLFVKLEAKLKFEGLLTIQYNKEAVIVSEDIYSKYALSMTAINLEFSH